MITVTSGDYNDMVAHKEEEIVLHGRPSSLTGKVTLLNKADDAMFVKEVPLKDNARIASLMPSFLANNLPINATLQPREERTHVIKLRVHALTPPGVYESKVVIGGVSKKLKLVVHENIAMKIQPRLLYFSGTEPGKTYSRELLLTNNSNIAITVPENKHNTALDFDYICKNLSLAIREKGAEGFQATMDAFTKNIHDDMIDWVNVNIDEAGATVEPGASMTLHLSLTFPQNTNINKDYFGNIRLWNKTITYKIKAEKGKSASAKPAKNKS